MNNIFKNSLIWILIIAALFAVFNQLSSLEDNRNYIPYSSFIGDVHNKNIKEVVIQGHNITAISKNGTLLSTYMPNDIWLINDLIKSKASINVKPVEEPSLLTNLLVSCFPMLILVVVWVFFMRQMQGGGKGGAFSFGKSKARVISSEDNKITFADVAGCDEAKEDVAEIVDFLRSSEKYEKVGGRIPKGVMLIGVPGTGKTLLAKAIAGEAKVPFYIISGSDFVEMFVGVGAARVRDMFDQAKRTSPCIIFIDEIDAVGRQRGVGLGGGNDEREQTLNQLLVELDGFENNSGIVVIAATNRSDVLDPALLRPGRFDRQIVVSLPDIVGREAIIKIHTKNIPLDEDVNINTLARSTPGFSGADLANMMNEGALFTARSGRELVTMNDFELARDKIVMGSARKSMIMSDEEKRITAYHESGHAIVAMSIKEDVDPVHKVTILPRGRALGVTMQLPVGDRYSTSKERMLNSIAILLSGRIAEELFIGKVTTGASNDFERATAIARAMVSKYGMSDKLGMVVYGDDDHMGNPTNKCLSEKTIESLDSEIKRIIDFEYTRAKLILVDNSDKMHAMSKALLDMETIDSSHIALIMEGKTLESSTNKDSSEYVKSN